MAGDNQVMRSDWMMRMMRSDRAVGICFILITVAVVESVGQKKSQGDETGRRI